MFNNTYNNWFMIKLFLTTPDYLIKTRDIMYAALKNIR